jgi:hypothetical protein
MRTGSSGNVQASIIGFHVLNLSKNKDKFPNIDEMIILFNPMLKYQMFLCELGNLWDANFPILHIFRIFMGIEGYPTPSH